jgi:Mg-chelatase subunit ChlD
VQRVADRIATDGEGLQQDSGLSNGPVLGHAYRLVTDGACLARWNVSENADGMSVSVLLDCSGSMTYHLAECAGIARAFAAGMRTAGEVQTLAFGDDVVESDFSRVGDFGGTATDKALKAAVAWLTPRAGKRWIVLVTDGQPNDAAKTAELCRQAAAAGVQILAVGIGRLVPVPFAHCVCAGDAAHLAIELDAAAHLIERGE